MEIIPAIYILSGRCVALYKSSYFQKATYFKSPVEMARFFENEGAKKLHVIDLNGRRDGGFTQRDVVKRLIKAVKIPVQIEAGFNNMQDIAAAFEIGASKIALRPYALSLLKEALETYGPEKIIVEIQAKGSEVVMVAPQRRGDNFSTPPSAGSGGEKNISGELPDVVDFAEKLVPFGVKEIIYKDERSEGTLIHPNYDEVDRLFLITGKNLRIYVSGGIADAKHLQLLKKIGATGAIIGKAFYERLITVKEAEAAVQ